MRAITIFFAIVVAISVIFVHAHAAGPPAAIGVTTSYETSNNVDAAVRTAPTADFSIVPCDVSQLLDAGPVALIHCLGNFQQNRSETISPNPGMNVSELTTEYAILGEQDLQIIPPMVLQL